MQTITNNVPRLLVDAWDLTAKERAEFDYLDWPAIDAGTESATFFRYRGQLYDLGEFMRSTDPEISRTWHGIATDTFFSATVVRLVDDDHVVVGRIYS